MKHKKALRLLALLLSVLLVMQCAAAALEPEDPADPLPALSEPGEKSPDDDPPADPAPADPDDPGPGDPDDPGPGDVVPAEPITVTASLSDGQVVNNPRQSLTVQVLQGEAPAESAQITVTLNGEAVEPADDAYALRLVQGDNAIVITAAVGSETETRTLAVRFEIAIPDGWSHDALAFCVEHGILKGNQDGDLQATANATRAELAAMLVRLFGVQKLDALSGFVDVPAGAWYHDEMAKAVAMGIYKGSGNKLNPANRITREEAFVVLARAFGVIADDTAALDNAPDKAQVSAWAANAMAGMLASGLVNGYKDGSLKPKGFITRQELAQVLYNALDCITDDPDALTGSRCLYTGPADKLEGKQINGDLIICSPDADLNLNDLGVTGRLVLHLHNAAKAAVGTDAAVVSLCSPTALTLKNPVKQANCLHDGAELSAKADVAVLDGAATLHGSYGKVVCLSGKSVIAQDAAVTEARASAALTLNGAAETVYAFNKCTAIDGAGSIGTLYKYNRDLTVQPTVGATVERIDAGLDGVSIRPGPVAEAYYDIPTVTATGTVTGVNTTQVFGVPDGVRICTVSYYCDGKLVKQDKNFRLTEGATLSCQVTPSQRYLAVEDHPVTVTIAYQGQTVTGELKVRTMGNSTPLTLAKGIRTCNVNATILRSTSVYAYSSLSGYVTSVEKGEVVYFIKSNGSTSLIETKSGKRGWVSDSAIRVSWRTYHNDDVSYTLEAKEAFVNQLHDYSSSTKYLVWVNLYTTTVNIFEGSKGNWKLIKFGECTIGAPETPTRPGVYSIYSKTHHWSFDDTSSGRTDVSRCNYVSLFDGGIAFHTRLYYSGTSSFYGNSSLSAELSHGCVRCPDEIAIFIYNNCPIGTRVVVY